MSNDQESDPSGHYDPFSYNHNEIDDRSICFPFLNHSSNNHPSALLVTQQALQGFDDPSPYMSYTDCLHGSMDYNTLSKAFDMSCSSSEVISQIDDNYPKAAAAAAAAVGESAGNSEIPSTPNSSISSSSNEAAGDEDSGKSKKKEEKQAKGSEDVGEEADEKSKKVSKTKKKEKRPREPRFAFLTKSEIDHLEDGYRWRKYGQKAVKNSPYPRSYYRCTTQKCTVKKRVERSFQDPSIVITTYEGQHNHHCPATLRGNAAAMLSPSLFSATASVGQTSLHHDFFTQLLPMNHIDHHHHHQHQHQPPNSMLYSNLISSSTSTPHRQQLQLPDFGLLQDLVPSSFAHKQGQ